MCDNLNGVNSQNENPEKNIPLWHKRDTVFAVITLIASILFVDWSAFGGFNAGFTVSFIMLFALTAAYFIRLKKSFGAFSVFCGFSSVAFSVIFLIYNNRAFNILFFIAAVFLYGIFVSYGFTENGKNQSPVISSFNTVIISPFDNMAAPFCSYKSYRKEKSVKPFNRQVLLGIVLSVPVLIIVLPLLIRSDAAFEGLASSAFSKCGILIVKILLGAAAAVYLFSMLFALKNNLKPKNYNIRLSEDYKKLAPITAVTLTSVLSAVYLIYLLSQSAYFSGGFFGILPKGYAFSLSDYARRGFFELCAVCAVNLAVVFLILFFVKRSADGSAAALSTFRHCRHMRLFPDICRNRNFKNVFIHKLLRSYTLTPYNKHFYDSLSRAFYFNNNLHMGKKDSFVKMRCCLLCGYRSCNGLFRY